MLSLVSGLVLTAITAAIFLAIMPRAGVPHRLATKPVLDWVIPMAITSGLVLGIAMIISGAVELWPA